MSMKFNSIESTLMDDIPEVFEVTIKAKSGRFAVSYQDEDVGWAIGAVIEMLPTPCRKELAISQAIRSMYEGDYEKPALESTNDAIDKMLDAATEISDAWAEFDEGIAAAVANMRKSAATTTPRDK